MLRLFKYFVVVVFLFFSCEGHAATLHAILVGDVEDPTIGSAVRTDIALMHTRVQDIARFTDMSLSETIFIEREYNSDMVIKELKHLRVAPDDVVIYYHSSHGFRTKTMPEPWPALHFGNKSNPMRLQYFIDLILAKKPAFTLVVADACNTLVNFAWPTFPRGAFYSDSPNDSEQKKGYRRLFRETCGCLIISSSSPGQSSYSFSNIGSILTGSFLSGIDHSLIVGQADWNKIMEATDQYAKKLTSRYGLQQTPKFQLN